ncbi:hypothetical protein ACIGXM_31750 [Kitasatospora sp. NPDC052896]
MFQRAAAHFARHVPTTGRHLLVQPQEHAVLLQLADRARLRPPRPR